MYIYPCGIVDSNDDWVFQGVVVAKNVREAKSKVVAFKKEHNLIGESVVDSQMKCKSKRDEGVYGDTVLN